MTLTLYIGFYEPWSGAWVAGERKIWVDDEKDAQRTEQRYAAYFKFTYGESAEVVRMGLTDD